MARPIDEDRRIEIAQAALAVLRERGVQGTRMSHIADALEMKRPTLYHYFGSIPELFEYAVEQLRQDEVEFVAQRIAGADHPIEAVSRCLRSAIAFYRTVGIEQFVFLICQGWASGDAAQRERFSHTAMRYLDPLRTLLIGVVAHGMAEGRIGPCDPQRLVDAALSTLHGAIVHEVLVGASADESIDFFCTRILEPLRIAEAP